MSSSDRELSEHDKEVIKYKKPYISQYKYFIVFHSIYQMFLSALLFYIIFTVIQLKVDVSLFVFIPTYLFNIYLIYNCPTYNFISNPVKGKTTKEIIDDYIKAVPLIHIKTESFHYDDSNQKIITSVHDELI